MEMIGIPPVCTNPSGVRIRFSTGAAVPDFPTHSYRNNLSETWMPRCFPWLFAPAYQRSAGGIGVFSCVLHA